MGFKKIMCVGLYLGGLFGIICGAYKGVNELTDYTKYDKNYLHISETVGIVNKVEFSRYGNEDEMHFSGFLGWGNKTLYDYNKDGEVDKIDVYIGKERCSVENKEKYKEAFEKANQIWKKYWKELDIEHELKKWKQPNEITVEEVLDALGG